MSFFFVRISHFSIIFDFFFLFFSFSFFLAFFFCLRFFSFCSKKQKKLFTFGQVKGASRSVATHTNHGCVG